VCSWKYLPKGMVQNWHGKEERGDPFSFVCLYNNSSSYQSHVKSFLKRIERQNKNKSCLTQNELKRVELTYLLLKLIRWVLFSSNYPAWRFAYVVIFLNIEVLLMNKCWNLWTNPLCKRWPSCGVGLPWMTCVFICEMNT